MVRLGQCYSQGKGIDKNQNQAAYWFGRAAKKGHAVAMYQLGRCYEQGLGVKKNQKTAIHWWRKAAELGNSSAIFKLGASYAGGKASPQSDDFRLLSAETTEKAAAPAEQDRDMVTYPKQKVRQARKPAAKTQVSHRQIPLLEIVPNSIRFSDASGNKAIDARETCMVSFLLQNKGKGTARGCVARILTDVAELQTEEKQLDDLAAGQSVLVELMVTGSMQLTKGHADLSVSVSEAGGFGTDPVILTVPTHSFMPPHLEIVDYAITSTSGTKLEKKKPFELTLLLQNTEHGLAEMVQVSLHVPGNVYAVDGNLFINIDTLRAGQQQKLTYTLIASDNYRGDKIPVKIRVKEKYGKYAESKTITLALNEPMAERRVVIDEVSHHDISIAQLGGKTCSSDVDENIPETHKVNAKTFAVIIANENYVREQKVDYAANDGQSFAVYCRKVLGLPEENIHVVTDATLNDIRHEVRFLSDVAEAYRGDAQVIFYYAGHGIPDESTKEAYLLPVDGYGSDVETGYSLKRLYERLASVPTRSTVVFLDACFSGSQRSGEMLSSARGVSVRTRSAAPRGKLVVFSASQNDETAYPYRAQRHGLFTYYLLKKLQETRGRATLGELSQYVIDQVSRQSVVFNQKSQTPTVLSSPQLRGQWERIRLR